MNGHQSPNKVLAWLGNWKESTMEYWFYVAGSPSRGQQEWMAGQKKGNFYDAVRLDFEF